MSAAGGDERVRIVSFPRVLRSTASVGRGVTANSRA